MPVDHRENVQGAVAAVGKHAALMLSDEEADAAIEAVIEGLMEPGDAAVDAVLAVFREPGFGHEADSPYNWLRVYQAALTAELARLKEGRRVAAGHGCDKGD